MRDDYNKQRGTGTGTVLSEGLGPEWGGGMSER